MLLRQVFRKELGILLPIIFYFCITNSVLSQYIKAHIANKFLLFVLVTSILFFMLQCAFNIVKHAHYIAESLGEPRGTLILTLSVVTIEVAMILSLLSGNKSDPNVIRDTTFAVIMMAINGFAGLSLLIGGIKYNRQKYNLEGASSYLALIICLTVICLIIPSYSNDAGVPRKLQIVVISMICYILYITFIIQQTVTHTDYFRFSSSDNAVQQLIIQRNFNKILYHGIALLLGLVVMIKLSKSLGNYLEIFLFSYKLPKKLAGFIVGSLVLSPEGFSAIQASRNNQLQRSINLCLGSVLASLSMTLPTVLLYSSFVLKKRMVLGIGTREQIILMLTGLISIITFTSKKTSSLYGMVFLSILATYLILL